MLISSCGSSGVEMVAVQSEAIRHLLQEAEATWATGAHYFGSNMLFAMDSRKPLGLKQPVLGSSLVMLSCTQLMCHLGPYQALAEMALPEAGHCASCGRAEVRWQRLRPAMDSQEMITDCLD